MIDIQENSKFNNHVDKNIKIIQYYCIKKFQNKWLEKSYKPGHTVYNNLSIIFLNLTYD